MKNYNDKIIYRKQRQLETVATIFINGFVFIILFFLNPGHKYSEIQKSCLENKNLAHEFPENPVAKSFIFKTLSFCFLKKEQVGLLSTLNGEQNKPF